MNEHRPDPDELLKQLELHETQKKAAKLKIFLGAISGVGKTYAMLEAAHACAKEGIDVVVGYIDAHERKETEILIQGLERLPVKKLQYRNTEQYEFDLDLALKRAPQLILVDELAHTNVPGSRHLKRWKDIQELLDSGIDVYTTLNIQHLESLNDIVAQITGVVVRETIPDSIFERADQITLIDLPPEDLLQRLKEGKIYGVNNLRYAQKNFFRKGNLIALRELALRYAASKVDIQISQYRKEYHINVPWSVSEKLLVCIDGELDSVNLIRTTKHLVSQYAGEWFVVFVETPESIHTSQGSRDRMSHALSLAEQLGAKVVTLYGDNKSSTVIAYANQNGITKIVTQKPNIHSFWAYRRNINFINQLIYQAKDIDVYILDPKREMPHQMERRPLKSERAPWQEYILSLTIFSMFIGISASLPMTLFYNNPLLIYFLSTVLIAITCKSKVAIFFAILNALVFDFQVIKPIFMIHLSSPALWINLSGMVLVALLVNNLTASLKQQMTLSTQREKRTYALYKLSKDFIEAYTLEQILQTAVRSIGDLFESEVVILIPNMLGYLRIRAYTNSKTKYKLDDNELSVATWVFHQEKLAGLNTDTLPSSSGLYLPLKTGHGMVGVLGVIPHNEDQFSSTEQMHLLGSCATQTALAIERIKMRKK